MRIERHMFKVKWGKRAVPYADVENAFRRAWAEANKGPAFIVKDREVVVVIERCKTHARRL